jgi:hypothetical protein
MNWTIGESGFDSLEPIDLLSNECQGCVPGLSGRGVTLITDLHLVLTVKKEWRYTSKSRPRLILAYSANSYLFTHYFTINIELLYLAVEHALPIAVANLEW